MSSLESLETVVTRQCCKCFYHASESFSIWNAQTHLTENNSHNSMVCADTNEWGAR